MMTPNDTQRPEARIGVTEGARRATGVTPIEAQLNAPDPEVGEKMPRRRFTAGYKLRILDEADAYAEPGRIGALLRRKGLYSSNLTNWRKQRAEGLLNAFRPKKGGRKPQPRNPLAARVAELQRANQQLKARLKKAETIIEVQKNLRTLGNPTIENRQRRKQLMSAAGELRARVGTTHACDALDIPRASFYRSLNPATAPAARPASPLTLSIEERDTVIEPLHSPRFQDQSPRQVYACLLDEGCYHCSVRTMYRTLEAVHGEVKERRRQVERPAYEKPEMVAHRESAALAERLIRETIAKQRIMTGQLTIHADRGSSMKSKCLAQLLVDMRVTKTHSRPYVSNDNPFSEAQFKTLKYCPQFPQRFGSIQDARSFSQGFFNWYNKEHRHSGIGLVTPEQLHYGIAREVVAYRVEVLRAAFEANPNRFKGKVPQPPASPRAVWINKPSPDPAGV